MKKAVCRFDSKDAKHIDPLVSVEMDLPSDMETKSEERIYNRNDNIVHAERNEYSSRTVKSYVISSGGDTV